MSIALPQKIEFKKGKDANNEIVVIESLFPGYGATIGNSLRRVLLSSLKGSAVVGVKIKGVTHEFMNLPGVKEDILTIILNLKQLRLKVHTDEVVKLELDVTGKKEVKAGDISKNADVEVINKDLVLANITDKAANLNMEIAVTQGQGYETVESRETSDKETGYIEIDSIFSPVSSIKVNVENVRVGKMTNWDKLNLDITTDGIISPREAFEQSVNILIEQFNALVPGDTKKKKTTKEKKEEEK